MPEKDPNTLKDLIEALLTSALFALVGASIGLGKLMMQGGDHPRRTWIGRAISTAGIAMAAGSILVWVPSLPLLGQIGVAAGLASLGTSGLERLFARAVGGSKEVVSND